MVLSYITSQRDYLLRAYREGRLNYAQTLKNKLLIGSGGIESLIRQVVNLRIKILAMETSKP